MGRAGALREEALAKFIEAKALVGENDEVSPEQVEQFNALMSEGKQLDADSQKAASEEGEVVHLRDRLSFYAGKASGGQPLPFQKVVPADRGPRSLGEAFVASPEYGALKASGVLNDDGSSAQFRTNPVRLPIGAAATDVIGTGTGPAGGLVTPHYLPEVLPLPQRPLTIRDLFGQATTEADLISYARQSGFDNAAAAVAQATSVAGSGQKSQSSIAWLRETSPVETLATWMATTRRTLADAGQVRGLIDNQGREMIRQEEEDQLLNGNGTSPNLRGLNNTTGVQTYDVSAAAGSGDFVNIKAVRRAATLTSIGVSRMRSDAIVVNPTDSEAFDLTTDLNNQFRAGGPFGGDAGMGSAPIWRLRRVESEMVTAGTAWVGAFRTGATVYEREGIAVYVSESHLDFFTRNLIAILFEERLGFAVFWPSAFVKITFKAWG